MFYYRNGSDEQLIMNTAHEYQFSLFDETQIAALVINATSQLWNNQFSCKVGVNRPRNSDRRDIVFYLFLTSITGDIYVSSHAPLYLKYMHTYIVSMHVCACVYIYVRIDTHFIYNNISLK